MDWDAIFHNRFKIISKHLPDGTEKYHENTSQHIRNSWTEIRTWNFPKITF
jgi:hypothetical protein